MISRTDVRSVSCPACEVHPGQFCVGRGDNQRIGCHTERWQVYRAGLPILLPSHLRPVIYRGSMGNWLCATSRDWRVCRNSFAGRTPLAAYLKWFMRRDAPNQRAILAAHPNLAQHLDDSLRHYLQVTR